MENLVKTMQRRKVFYIAVILLFFGVNLFVPKTGSQNKPFTIGQILRAIASINQERGNKKKLLSDKIIGDVRQRKVDFPLTKENETLLRNEGATDELINVIRQSSPPPPTASPQYVNVGNLSRQAINLLKPDIPQRAAQMGASGRVTVQVVLDENGKVVSVKAISGHVYLRDSTEAAVRQSSFNPVIVGGKVVKATGTITYDFTNNNDSIWDSTGIAFIRISAGSFMMGSPTTEANRESDETQHQVTLSKSFYLGKYEVTQGQWKSVMGNNPSSFKNCGDKCPVENVSWEDVQEFIKKLNAKGEGTYRLPTEAEWEYAARAGSTTKYSFGDSENSLVNYAWYSSNAGGKTNEVGLKQPNKWGLYDMHGNVGEWCADWYESYPNASVTVPRSSNRMIRGGGGSSAARELRSAYRLGNLPSIRGNFLGFRLVME